MKKTKRLLVALFSTVCAISMFAACTFSGKESEGPQFLEGILTEIELGETLKLDEYIELPLDSEYTVTITKDDFSYDLGTRGYWTPEEPGTYTLTYTVNSGENKGTKTLELTVAVPKMTWEYTLSNRIYDTGDTLVFAHYFEEMNIAADSYYPWEMIMDSVTVGNETTTFDADDISYTFVSDGMHVFAFHIQSEDGQSISMTQSIQVRYVDSEMMAWMEENGVTTYNALALNKDGSVVLSQGVSDYIGSNSIPAAARKTDSPYVAYNGNYGLNDFVIVDFTGNNMPTISMFNGEITNSFFYSDSATEAQNKGLVFSNGLTYGSGIPVTQYAANINNRYQVLGPNKVFKTVDDTPEGQIRANIGTALGMTTLSSDEYKDARFRLAIGVTEGDADHFKVAICLVNLDTGEFMQCDERTVSTTVQYKVNNEDVTWKADMSEDYYSGSIALYGLFGRTTTLDKIYAIDEDTTFDKVKETWFATAAFKDSAKAIVATNEVLNVSDYIQVENASYILSYVDKNGNEVQITDDTFSFTEAGGYTLVYKDGVNLPGQLTITVMDMASEMVAWMEENNVSLNNALSAEADRKVVLSASTHNGAQTLPAHNTTVTATDMSYVSFNGNYGINDYVVFEFTGGNMPTIAFFQDENATTPFNHAREASADKKGLVFINGLYLPTGSIYGAGGTLANRLSVMGPYGLATPDDDVAGVQYRHTLSNGQWPGAGNLANTTAKYRMVVGFSAGSTTGYTIRVWILNLDDGTEYEFSESAGTKAYDGVTLPADYFSGKIALYGQFGKTTTLDKVYAIEEDTTFGAVKTKYAYETEDPVDPEPEDPVDPEPDPDPTPDPEPEDTRPEWMKSNNIYADKYESTQDWQVTLSGSTHNADAGLPVHNPNVTATEMSYVSFNGNYGINDYVVFEFTGGNMPLVAFFQDENAITPFNVARTANAANKGLVFVNGLYMPNGSIFGAGGALANRMSVLGPYGAVSIEEDIAGVQYRHTLSNGQWPGAGNLANTTAKYRMVVGFSAGSTTGYTIRVWILNLDDGTEYEFSESAGTKTYSDITLAEDYFSGKIALYGQFGKTTTLDKVYAIEEDTTFGAVKAKYAYESGN